MNEYEQTEHRQSRKVPKEKKIQGKILNPNDNFKMEDTGQHAT